ncbi:hypothetical protein AVEN_162472-1 [Araneus ventricosus]|uniref:Uncharacterized protein n=1 Tax=Araneus ventricosus TaxID=182803 RepID=A0A4Y2SEW6_ARAVE|nr:hypothetical protein AVEN_162472-1 [Araneus ventricosus]
MKQKMKEFQTQESEKMSKKAKLGCKQMLKGLQNEDGDNLQTTENADFRGQVKRAKVSKELWVSHLIGALLNEMVQLIAREPGEVTE